MGGVVARYTSENSRWNTASTLRMKLGHKIFGYLTLFVAHITLILGGLSYSSFNGVNTARNLTIVGMVSVIVLIITFETLL